MILRNDDAQQQSLLVAASHICVAARTAPKGRGKDLLQTAILTDEDKDRVTAQMRLIADRDNAAIFVRDAANVDGSPVLVVFGTRKEPLGLPHCGFCGFADCAALVKAGAFCAFNTGDLGIALGSAVSRAADLRLDNRLMYTVGKAVMELELLGPDVRLAYGLPLSATGKSPFFDRPVPTAPTR